MILAPNVIRHNQLKKKNKPRVTVPLSRVGLNTIRASPASLTISSLTSS